ncbi:MAG: sulfatase-like hydrolase/transferase [Verrucomicrobia bacterium]|jgi:uncharacterized sulfatase|nr:sulfatase-like hydrolase/transferase [Verrucomicrobiota bacterium]
MKSHLPPLASLAAAVTLCPLLAAQENRPNILWIVAEDLSPTLGCYGDDAATSPELDALAGESLRYTNAWANAPVCSAARTTLITGMYANTLGAHNHRPETEIAAPEFLRFYTDLLQEAGYYTTNTSIETRRENNGSASVRRGNGKLDYNVTGPDLGWDDRTGSGSWRNRPADTPFFSVFNIGDTHESRLRWEPPDDFKVHDPNDLTVPNVHPDNATTRADWARHYDWIYAMDTRAGELLAALEADGLADDTIVFFYGDHGSCMPGFKRFVGNRGQEVPLLIHIPEKYAHLRPADYAAGGTTDRLVGFVDFAATLLSMAGAEIPEWMHGEPFAGEEISAPREYQFGFIGRIDERTWKSHVVTDGRHVLIRNYRSDQPQGFYSQYVVGIPNNRNTEMAYRWLDRFLGGPIDPEAAAYWIAQGPVELYDLQEDPYETRNLAHDPAYADKRAELLAALSDWEEQHRYGGFLPEGYLYELAQDENTDHWSVLQDPALFPYENLLTAARRASAKDPEDEGFLLEQISHEHPLLRLWGVRGLMMHGRETVRAREADLRPLLEDPDYYVKVAAHQCLATHGDPAEREGLVDWLFQRSSLPEHGGENLVVNNVTDRYAERRVLFAMQALDQLPYFEEERRAQTRQLQNQTWQTQGYRRHLFYWFFDVFSNPLAAWRFEHGLSRSGANDFDNPSGDGIPNLLRFLFNTAPEEGDLARPSPGPLPPDGDKGGPAVRWDVGNQVFVLEYIRPRSSAHLPCDTVAQQSEDSTWRNFSLPDETTAVDDVYERVRYEIEPEEISPFFRVLTGRKLP